jgi:translation initiation factor IF-3
MAFDNRKYRVNYQIKMPSVRVCCNNEQFGVLPIDKARNMALEQGLDLIEINPTSNPPTCIIADFNKFLYENKLKEKENRKKQKSNAVVVKEIRLTPTIGDHDLATKMNAIEKFIDENKKVQIAMKFTHRELLHKEIGIQKINLITDKLQEKIQIEMPINFVGLRMFCRIAPRTAKA